MLVLLSSSLFRLRLVSALAVETRLWKAILGSESKRTLENFSRAPEQLFLLITAFNLESPPCGVLYY